jgi:hypothetical protein
MSFKALLAATLALIALNASADEKFDKAKQETLAHLDSRIQALTETKTCVNAATDMAALKKCHLSLREEHMDLRGKMMEKRKARIDEQMKKLEAEKNKLEDEQKKK